MTTKPRILYIDDELPNLTNFAAAFDEEYEIFTAQSGEEGLRILDREGEMAVVVSDQRMPGITGVDALFEIRKRYPDTVRIVLTAYTETPDLIDAINRGHVYRYIVKPWDENELRMSLKNSVGVHNLVRENKRLLLELETKNSALTLLNTRLEDIVTARTMELHEKSEILLRRNEEFLQVHLLANEQKKALELMNVKLHAKIDELEKASAHIDLLRSLLPVCSYCKKIRRDKNYWLDLDKYFIEHMNLKFTHSICPTCYVNHVKPQLEELNIQSSWTPTDEDYDRMDGVDGENRGE